MHETVDLQVPRDALISLQIIAEAHLPGPEINPTSLIAGVVGTKECGNTLPRWDYEVLPTVPIKPVLLPALGREPL